MTGKVPLLIGAALGVALAGGWALVDTDLIRTGPVGPSLTSGFAAPVRQSVSGTDLQTAMLELQRTLARQEERITQLEAQLAAVLDDVSSTAGVSTLNEVTDAAAEDAASPPAPRGAATVATLVEQGFAEADAKLLVADLDALQLERLQLMYRANGPGGADTNALSEAFQALPSERELVEERFGEAAYDEYLYASERPNRLVVQDVLNNSPAAAIGIQSGDQLISAANQRIYTVGDLVRAAATATDGQMALVIRRGDALIESVMPAGPLGVTTSRERIQPALPIR